MSFAASAVRALRQAPKVAQRGFQTSKSTASVRFDACRIFTPDHLGPFTVGLSRIPQYCVRDALLRIKQAVPYTWML